MVLQFASLLFLIVHYIAFVGSVNDEEENVFSVRLSNKGLAGSLQLDAGICLVSVSFCFWYYKLYGLKESKLTKGCSFEEKSMVRKEMFCFRTDDLENLSETMEQCTFVPLDTKVNFDLEQLLKASAFLVVKSNIGIVYKVVLEKGLTVAVRRLKDGGSRRFMEFQSAEEEIGKSRHPNIVSLLAYCWGINEKLLICDYVPNDDLATLIHGRTGMTHFKSLSWSVRLKIMKGLAKGLAYLHECSPKRPSQKWDVYSFGVILLEMISGKSPKMQVSLSGMDLVQWIQLSFEGKPPSEVLDPFLTRELDKEHEMVAVLKIALACVHASPDKRPSMKNASDNLGRLFPST
ncbi:hypothetical protein SADUNF_Sadunf17G0110800 [Salix dunnii]|uniref:Protein kinase domain-containing protein n=1 Tax=Salix dunnii TaxID=1413687 RepID=A0A835J5Q5_9ROSI|nr:hypothetical protein SADUNF_Sadunf17G0110800 [Salix dunnii]